MENQIGVPDPHEEVRKLQEKVRALELQLSQQTSRTPKNGIECATNVFQTPVVEVDCELVDVFAVDFSDCRTWLECGAAAADFRNLGVDADPTGERAFARLRHDGDPTTRRLYSDICHAEQDRRKNIDTRTFTRPKKRMGRPGLEVLESFSRLSHVPGSSLAWGYDDVKDSDLISNMTCSILTSSLICSESETDLRSPSNISRISNNNFQKIASQPELRQSMLSTTLEDPDLHCDFIDKRLLDANFTENILMHPKTKLNISNKRSHVSVNSPLTSPHPLNSTFNKGSDPGLNRTYQEIGLSRTHSKEDGVGMNTTFTPPCNGTFSMGIQRTTLSLARPGSADSCGADDDQLSSTSDSSHTSATRLMSVGDVQNIARLQEESLTSGLITSTPLHVHAPVSKFMFDEDSPSPTLAGPGSGGGRSDGQSDVHGGYGSDQSSRSPMSSLHSSPAGSPFGSSTALPGSQPYHSEVPMTRQVNGALSRRGTYGMLPPVRNKVSAIRPPSAVNVASALPNNVPSSLQGPRPQIRSGLRPPMVRVRSANVASGLPRPASTGIPRPGSRIPPPKIRMSRPSQPMNRQDWTDECY